MEARKVEWLWAWKLLEYLKNLKRVHKIEHLGVKELFADLAQEYNYKYVCGNDAVLNQMIHIVAQREVRANMIQQAVHVKDPKEWLEQQHEREKKRQLERAMKVIEEREDKSDTVREEEDEADTVEAEDEVNTVEGEEKMVIEDDSHVMMWEKDKVLVVDGKPQFLQSMSPVKIFGVKRGEWKDP